MSYLLQEIEDEWSEKWFNFFKNNFFEGINWKEKEIDDYDAIYYISKNPFLTPKTLKSNPNFPWNWGHLSSTQPFERVVKSLDLPWSIPLECPGDVFPKEKLFWDWKILSAKTSWEEIEKHPSLPWIWKSLLRNKTVPFDFFSKYPSSEIDWSILSNNPNVPWEIILSNVDKKLNWISLSQRDDITWEIVRDNLGLPWDWLNLSKNPAIPWKTIKENLVQPWLFEGLSSRDDLDLNFVAENFLRSDFSPREEYYFERDESSARYMSYLHRETKWTNLCQNKILTLDFVLAHPEFPWQWGYLGNNPNFDLEFLINTPKVNWNILAQHPKLTFEFILSHLHLEWDWAEIAKREFITVEILKSHPDRNWNGYSLSKNLNIPPEYLIDNFYISNTYYLLSRKDITFELLQSKIDPKDDNAYFSWMPDERERFIRSRIKELFRPLILFLLEEKEMPLDLVESILKHF